MAEFSANPAFVDAMVFSVGTLNKRAGREQNFKYGYVVTLKSKSKHDLTGCNLHQKATTTLAMYNAGDAKPQKPEDYNKPKGKKGFTSTVKGNVITTIDVDDYVHAGVTFDDNPGLFRSDPNGFSNTVTKFQFRGDVYVEEAPAVTGSIDMAATFNLDTIGGSAVVRSSDGKIDRKETL